MDWIAVLLALLPVVLVFVLLTWRRWPADSAGVAAWALVVVLALAYFRTAPNVVILSSVAGVVASLPIALVVAASILQMTLMQEVGALRRLVVLIKTVARNDQVVQIMLINVGVGTLLTTLGTVPVSMLPPIMLGLGYSSFVAVALPAIGYDSLTTYALLGVPVVVFSGFTNKPVNEVGGLFAQYMPVVTTLIAISMLYIVGKWRLMLRGIVPVLITGLTAGFIAIGMNRIGLTILTGIAAGAGVILAMLAYLKLRGGVVVDRSGLTADDLGAEKKMSVWRAISPWLMLTVFSILINVPYLPFSDLFYKRLAMPIAIIPGAPERLRLLWQAYFWLFLTTLLVIPIYRPTSLQLKRTFRVWLRRAPRPVLAAAVFFAIAYVMNQSGKGWDWQMAHAGKNMITALANAAAGFGTLYPLAAPYLGLLGGFVSGSETSSIAMLTKLHLETSAQIGGRGLLIAAASAIGGGLASVISPAKLQNAAAAIDQIGIESSVIRLTIVISLVITLAVSIMTLIWGF